MDRGRVVVAVGVVACGPKVTVESGEQGGSQSSSDDASTSEQPTSSDTASGDASTIDPGTTTGPPPPLQCPGAGGPLATGSPCTENAQCASRLCLEFTDAPADASAVCAEAPSDCSTRFTGTGWLIPLDNQPTTGLAIYIQDLSEVLEDPAGAPVMIQTEASQPPVRGRFDVLSDGPLAASIGVVAVFPGNPSWYRTATVIALNVDGEYEAGSDTHDVWVTGAQMLELWSDALAIDPDLDPLTLPLGDAGGVIGVVRDATGLPIADATVVPQSPTARVRYLGDDGWTFSDVAVGSTGVFVILGASGGETVEARVVGTPVATGRAWSAPGIVFALALTSE